MQDAHPTTKAITAEQAALTLKNLGYDGFETEGVSFLDMFGAPGNVSSAATSRSDITQIRGWNHTAVLAKSLQFALGSTQVFVSPETAERVTGETGDHTTEAQFVTGVEGYDVPSDWRVAPSQHRIARLMRRPNPWTDHAQFWFQISQHIETHGVCCLLVLPNEYGQPSELYVVPRTQIQSLAGDTRFPEGYYRTQNLSRFPCTREFEANSLTLQERLQSLSNKDYSAKYIIEIGIPSLLYADDFLNPTSALADALDTDKEMHRARRNALNNEATAGPMLVEEPGVDLQPDEKDQILTEWQHKNAGPENQGKAYWKPKGIGVENTAHSGREMEYAESARESRDAILGQRLVPPAMVGMGNTASYAGVVGVVKTWSRMSGQPLMRLVAGQLTIGLQRFFSEENREFTIVMQAGNIDDPQTVQSQLDTDIAAKAITTKEYRERRNLPPFGDERDDAIIGTLGADPMGGMGGGGLGGLPGIAGGDTGPDRPGLGTDPALQEGRQEPTEYTKLSRREFTNSRKAITETLEALADNRMRERTARVMLRRFGLSTEDIDELVQSVREEPDPMIRRSVDPEQDAATAEPEEQFDNEFAKGMFDRFMHASQTPENVISGFFKVLDEPIDGDGDGYVLDGTPEERPVRFEAGKRLTSAEREEVLANVADVYKENGLNRDEIKGYDHNGDPIYGYPYAPELFVSSDITGAKMRYYIMMPDGTRAHPSELFPNIKQNDVLKAVGEAEFAEKMKKQDEANRLKRVRPIAEKNMANIDYMKTGRSMGHSYFAESSDSKVVRVDGTDIDDRDFFESIGFVPTSAPVAREMDLDQESTRRRISRLPADKVPGDVKEQWPEIFPDYRPPMTKGWFEKRQCQKDGDGDGYINDGTPQEQVAPKDCKKDESKVGRKSLSAGGDLYERIRSTGGFTYQPVTGQHPTKGFSVAIFPEHELKIPRDQLKAKDVAGYVLDKLDEVQKDDRIHIGAWDNQKTADNPKGDDIVYLDMSVVIDSRDEAFKLAKKHGQLGMFDLETFQTIEVMTKEERNEWEDRRKAGGQSTKAYSDSPRYDPQRYSGVGAEDAEGSQRKRAVRAGRSGTRRPARRTVPSRILTLKDGYTGYEVLPGRKSALSLKSKSCPRDGDGDGTVHDGTEQEKPVSSACSKEQPERKDRIKGPAKLVDAGRRILRDTAGDTESLNKKVKFSFPDKNRQKKYSEVFSKALNQLPPLMIDRVEKNVKGVEMLGDIGTVTEVFDSRSGQDRSANSVTVAFYNYSTGSMFLDGGLPEGAKYANGDTAETHRGIYVHELSHAADKLDDGTKFSESKSWTDAYNSEIKRDDAPLSNYATVNAQEGFAEMVRFHSENPEKAREMFPKSVAAIEDVYGRL